MILPGTIAVLLFLLWSGWKRGALAWAIAMGGVLTTVLVLKVLVAACDFGLPHTSLNSPSGHTAAAAAFYGGLVVILWPRVTGLATALIGTAIAVVFATTRLLLGYHTLLDVIVGGIVGVTGLIIFYRALGSARSITRRGRLVILLLLVMLAFHGHRLPTEHQLHHFAVTRVRATFHGIIG